MCRYIPVLKSNGGIVETLRGRGMLALAIEKADGRETDGVFGKHPSAGSPKRKLIATTPVVDNIVASMGFFAEVKVEPSDLSGKDGIGRGSWRSSEMWFDVFDHDEDSSPDFLGRKVFATN